MHLENACERTWSDTKRSAGSGHAHAVARVPVVAARPAAERLRNARLQSASSSEGPLQGGRDGPNEVAIDPAGNIDVVGLVYGHTQSNSSQLLLARLAPDGSFDSTFDTAASASVQTTFGTAGTDGFAIAIDANGNLAVAGQFGSANGTWALAARFTSSGVLDPTFNLTGYAITSFGTTSTENIANAVAFDANDQIVIAGHTGSDQFHAGEALVV